MRKLLLLATGVAAYFITVFVCKSPTERYVPVVEQSLPKTVMIEVTTIVPVYEVAMMGDGFDITRSTKTVTVRGAGVFISPTGHILSCAHLFWIGDVQEVFVTNYSGTTFKAELLYHENKRDLSLMKINDDTAYVKVADPRRLKVGQEVIAIGNPLGELPFSVSHGIISQLYRDFPEAYNETQTDAPINPGNSGGPLINLKGELVGINNLGYPARDGLGFSVQCGQIREFLTRFKGLEKAVK